MARKQVGAAASAANDAITKGDLDARLAVPVTGTPVVGAVPTASSPTTATWQLPAGDAVITRMLFR